MVFVYCALTCFAVAIVYNVLIRCFASLVIWLSILATGACIIALAVAMQFYHDDKYKDLPDDTTGKAL